jgi:predicted nucleic acid-binding protein
MARPLSRRYFDSVTIIRYVENDTEAQPVVQALINEASAGSWVLVVSALTLLEVTRRPGMPVDPAKHATILRFFDNPYIFVRELDILLVEQAQKLIYDYLWLYPQDAAHLAAAIDTRCEVFYTYDAELIRRFDGERGLRVQRPEMPERALQVELPMD